MAYSPPAALTILCSLALAGCGGGGGGGGTTDPTPVSVTTPIPVAFQTPGTTLTYQVDSASAAIPNGLISASNTLSSGNGATVTLTTNAAGNLSQVTFNVPTPGVSFTNTYYASSITQLPTITLSTLATALAALGQSPGSSGFIGNGAGLSYGTYGIWAANDTGTFGRIGVLGFGAATPVGSVPNTGTAVYNGSTIGFGSISTSPYALLGTIQLSANFTSGTVSSTLNNLQLQNLNTNALSSLSNLSGSSTISGNHYSGTLTGGSYTGTIFGTFNGPNVNETTGAWRATGTGATFIGSYGAHQ